MSTIATRANMLKYADTPDMLAYSPNTAEEYSASPGDYFWLPDDEPLVDGDGEPMILVRRVSHLVDVETGERPGG